MSVSRAVAAASCFISAIPLLADEPQRVDVDVLVQSTSSGMPRSIVLPGEKSDR